MRRNLTNKLFIILLSGLACLLLSEIITRRFLELPALHELEYQSEGKDVARVQFLLRHVIDDFGVTTTEYGSWDDTYRVVQPGTHPADVAYFANVNLYALGHSRLKLDGIILMDRDGRVLINAAYDPQADSFASTQTLDPASLAHSALIRPRTSREPELINAGLSNSNVGPVMFAASRVLPSLPPYPESAGTLIFWRHFYEIPAMLNGGARTSLEFIPFETARAAGAEKDNTLELALNPETKYLPSHKDGYIRWLLRDVDGSPLFLIRQQAKERLYNDGLLSQTVIVGFGFSALVLLIAGLVFCRSIIGRLQRTQVIIAEIMKSGKFDKRLHSAHEDELDSLFERINQLLGHIEEQDARLRTRNQHLEVLSEEDPLTGIPNRRYLDRTLDQCLRQSARMNRPMSFLMVDVDCFKAFNDRYGHQEGDAVLKQVAHTLRNQLHRATDHIARYGGEEFSVILLDTPNYNAIGVAESLRAAIENLDIRNEVSNCSDVVTVSIGVTTTTDAEPVGVTDVILSADKALYRAKETGRNRVCSQPIMMQASSGDARARA